MDETPMTDAEFRQFVQRTLAAHDSRILLLEDLMVRVIALTDVAIQLLQRQQDDEGTNGAA